MRLARSRATDRQAVALCAKRAQLSPNEGRVNGLSGNSAGREFLNPNLVQLSGADHSMAVVVPASPAADAKPVAGLITQSAMAEALAAGMELFGD